MKILLVSDLHCELPLLEWIQSRAPEFDVVAVAGDLLDIFLTVPPDLQERKISDWKTALASSGSWLVWSSGNHDFYNGEDSPLIYASPDWMHGSSANFLGDGATALITTGTGSLAVTTVPWPVTGADVVTAERTVPYMDYIGELLDEGKRLQQTHPWLALFHDPPIGTRLSIGYQAAESRLSRQIIEKWQPDCSLHGHVHESALHPEGDFVDHLNSTVCFNAGQGLWEKEPHHIILRIDGLEWSAKWASGEQRREVSGILAQRFSGT